MTFLGANLFTMFVPPIIKRLFMVFRAIPLILVSEISSGQFYIGLCNQTTPATNPSIKLFNTIKSAMLRLMSAVLLLFTLPSFNAFGADYYVATNGDDANAGTLAAPFKTVGHAVSQIASGDTLYIRGGTYRDETAGDNRTMISLHGRSMSAKTTIRNYNDEEVILSGARAITGAWTQHSGHIWTTNIWSDDGDDSNDFDVSQLFLNGEMLTGARWPNIDRDFDKEDADFWQREKWASTYTYADEDGNTTSDIADLKVNANGAIAFFRIGGWERMSDVQDHTPGTPTVTFAPNRNGLYYLEGAMSLLDKEGEWFYNKTTGDLYVWLPGNQDPNDSGLLIEGRWHKKGTFGWDYLVLGHNARNFHFEGLTFFAGTLAFSNSSHLSFHNNRFLYPAHHGMMLQRKAMRFSNSFPKTQHMTWTSNEFANSFSVLLDHGRRSHHVHIENNSFRNSNILLWGNNGGPILNGASPLTAIRNTVRDMGFSGMGRPGWGNTIELNHVYDTHWAWDTGGITVNWAASDIVIRRNWIHDMAANNCIRFDGHPGGIQKAAHHNVVFNCKRRGFRLKGDQHQIHNNLAFANGRIDLNIAQDKFYGYSAEPTGTPADWDIILKGRDSSRPKKGNFLSKAHNNAVNSYINSVQNPDDKTGNSWRGREGYDTGEDGYRVSQIQMELRDPGNFDFRPRDYADSPLIDQGTLVPGFTDAVTGITDGPQGAAPDIGPYEHGDTTYWIPGHQTAKARFPIAPDGSRTVKTEADLMWLEGLNATSSSVYLGTDPNNLQLVAMKGQHKNIYTPDTPFVAGTTYFWRVDTHTDAGTVVGDVWEFTVKAALPPLQIESVYVPATPGAPCVKRIIGQRYDVCQPGYGYYISKYEITNAQWAYFLNEVASYTNPAGLWTSSMQISRTNDGISNTWLYAADEGYENHPVTHVGFFNAARFANWMTSDSISEGIYHRLNTNRYYTTRGFNATSEYLNWEGAGGVALPTLNEWYKAAYFYPNDWSHMWVPGHSGNALPIRQLGWTTGSHVDLPDLERSTNTLTVAAWIKPNELNRSGIIFNQSGGLRSGLGFCSANGGELGFTWRALTKGNDNRCISSGMKPNLNEWSFVALVVDGEQLDSDGRGKADIYMRQAGDAAFQVWSGYGNANNRTELQINLDTPYIGRGYFVKFSNAFNGTVDEPMIFDRALTTAELESLFTGGSITNGLVGHWPFDESEGCTASDTSGNGYDAALMGCNEDGYKKYSYHATGKKFAIDDDSYTLTTDDANYNNPAGGPIAVGSYPHAPSFYGTFDQQGNVAEHVEQRTHGTGGSYADTRDSPFSDSDRMTYNYYAVNSARTGIRLVSRAPISRLSERTERPPEFTNHAEANVEDFSSLSDATNEEIGDGGTDSNAPIEGIDTTQRLLDGILGDPFAQALPDSFLDLSGGGLTFSAYDGPDWLSLSSDGQLILDTDNDGELDTAGLDAGKLGEYDVKFWVTGSNDLYVIHETSIEVIHPPAPIIEVMSSTEGTISFDSYLSEYAGYSAEQFFITCTSGALTYSAASVTGEITIAGMRNGLTYACTGRAENNGFMSDVSESLSVALPQSVPQKPIITRVSVDDGQIIIYLSDSHQLTTVDLYIATCTDGINTYVGSNNGNIITVDGLINGQEYSCRVSAENEAGTSEETTPSELITPRTGTIVFFEGFETPELNVENFPNYNGQSVIFGAATPSFDAPEQQPVDVGFMGDSGVGWRVENGNIEMVRGAHEASEGSQSLELNGFVPGAIKADIEFVTVGVHLLSFDVSKHPGTQDDASFSLILNEETVAGTPIVVSQSTSADSMAYQHVAIELDIASPEVYSLGFESVDLVDDNGINQFGAVIDNLQITFADSDNDGVNDGLDAFPTDTTESVDTDGDGIGNNADTDDDGDGVGDASDAFPLDASETLDTDGDGVGNNADTDDDGDGVDDNYDAFPLDATETLDTDSDGLGNNADTDDDDDGVEDSNDAFPLDASETVDTDGDGVGNNADTDDDGDGIGDASDAFPLDASETLDTDGDGVGNNADTDDDGDGVLDVNDFYPLISLGGLTDTDSDGLPNDCDDSCISLGMTADTDDDNDGVDDIYDAFPLDPTEYKDTDGDGLGDNADVFPEDDRYTSDSDSDGIADKWEIKYNFDPNDASDATLDYDNDGFTALEEFINDTVPLSLDLDGDLTHDALTDGLLILREMFGLDGSALITGTISLQAEFSSAEEIKERISHLGDLIDADGSGQIDALTDGLLILRFLFGLEGDDLTRGVLAPDATRDSVQVYEHLLQLTPQIATTGS